jgi:hypothetical protein
MLSAMEEGAPVPSSPTLMKKAVAWAKKTIEFLDVTSPNVHVADLFNRGHYAKPLTQEEAVRRAQDNLYTLRGFYVRVAAIAVFVGELCVGECFWSLLFVALVGTLLYVSVSDLLTKERKLIASAVLALYTLLFTPILPVAFVSCCTAAVLCAAHASVYAPPPTFA